MKKNFTKIFLLAVLSLASASVFAQAYALNAPDEVTLEYSVVWQERIYEPAEFTGPGDELTFELSRSAATAVGETEVQQYVNGQWQNIDEVMPSGKNKFQTFGPYKLDRNATKIRFYNGYGSYKRTFKNVLVTMATYAEAPAYDSWTASTATIGAADESAETTLAWSNVEPFTVELVGEGASQFTCAITNNASLGKHGVASISATYKHNVAGTHTAHLNITNGTYSYAIALTGTTVKKAQQISWIPEFAEDEVAMLVGVDKTDIASATSGLGVTYVSSDESVLAVEGSTLKPLKAGVVTLTAMQEGDETWESVSVTKTVKVTEKQIQYISWSDNLSRLKLGAEPFELNAVVQLLVNAETGDRMDSEERTAYLTYSSTDSTVVSVEGNVLTVVGEGEATLVAYVPGDDLFEEASASIPVKVYLPSTGCDDALLVNVSEEIEFFQMNLNEIVKDPIAIDRTLGVPGKLSFQHKGEYWKFALNYYDGSIKAQQSTDGGSNWSDIAGTEVTPTVGEYNTLTVDIDPNATHIRFVRPDGGQGYHYVSGIVVTPTQYLEANVSAIEQEVVAGEILTYDITVNYCNVKDEVLISNTNSNVSLSQTSLENECGDFGSKTFTVTITPSEMGIVVDEIVIEDAISGMRVSIPVVVIMTNDAQSIVWEDDLSDVHVFDTIMLNATAMTTVTYATSDANIATVEDNMLVLHNVGEVVVYAYAAADETYLPDTVAKTVIVSPLEQYIEWPLETFSMYVGDTLVLNAVATSGLEVNYTLESDEEIAVIEGNLLIAQAEGGVLVVASQEGDLYYLPAETVTYAIEILPVENTAVDNVYVDQEKAYKVVRNGQILIVKGNRVYDLLGNMID